MSTPSTILRVETLLFRYSMLPSNENFSVQESNVSVHQNVSDFDGFTCTNVTTSVSLFLEKEDLYREDTIDANGSKTDFSKSIVKEFTDVSDSSLSGLLRKTRELFPFGFYDKKLGKEILYDLYEIPLFDSKMLGEGRYAAKFKRRLSKFDKRDEKPVIFHTYWQGSQLNDRHYYSVRSCHHWNIANKTGRKIIFWLGGNNFDVNSTLYKKIAQYVEFKIFRIDKETLDTKIPKLSPVSGGHSIYSDYVRLVLLYNYGGVWFDLDTFFLRSFTPLFIYFGNTIMTYRWERQNYLNNALMISLKPKSAEMRYFIEYCNKIRAFGSGGSTKWFLTMPVPVLSLPFQWFDQWWADELNVNSMEQQEIRFDSFNFFFGAFSFHWHNRWDKKVPSGSTFEQLSFMFDKPQLNQTLMC